MSAPHPGLLELARLYGVQPSYEERPGGPERHATEETLIAVLRALGAPLMGAADVAEAVRAKNEERWARLLEPVTVVWGPADREHDATRAQRTEARTSSVPFTLAGNRGESWECALAVESGETREWRWRPADHDVSSARVPLPDPLPFGYHRLTVRAAGREASSWIFFAPEWAWDPDTERGEKLHDVGLFLPLYALHTRRNWGTGDLTDLAALLDWAGRRGVRFVGTLPLLATYLGGGRAPVDPGPYAPVSRLFWNELYLDVERAPGLDRSTDAQALLASDSLRAELERLRGGRRVRYAEAMAVKRRVLEALARAVAPGAHAVGGALAEYAGRRADALPYARFRAAMERRGPPWRDWPEEALGEERRGDEAYEDAVRYHLYVQWALEAQMRGLVGPGALRRQTQGPGHASALAPELYLDLPLGTHPEGFDTWHLRSAFVHGLSVGAPPDPLQLAGQDWGFHPLHPERTRVDGHAYFRRSVEHLMRAAGMLRLDHVMSLHRLYCIPAGHGPLEGAYVRYPAEELYAVLCIESRRWACQVIGEDLGTVPDEVRESMSRRRVGGMYLLPFELQAPRPGSDRAPHLPPPPPLAVASLGTHDLPPFAAYATGFDIRRRLEEGTIGKGEGAAQLEERADWFEAVKAVTGSKRDDEPLNVLPRALRTLANTAARHLLINAEDLWGETESQNQPGTVTDTNWSLRARHPLEEWSAVPELEETLSSVVEARRCPGTPAGGEA